MNELTRTDAPREIAMSNPLQPRSMNDAMRLAELMCEGQLVPTHLQKRPGDCLMVIEQSMRWGMSPFAVAQCTSVIHGKLMYEGKLVGAALLSSGILKNRLSYEFSGSGDSLKVVATATIKGESKPRDAESLLSKVKTTNDMWTKQPEQQLIYSVNRIWARRHAPEVMLGVYSPEEFDGQTINSTAETVKEEPKHTPMQTASSAPSEKTQQTVEALINQISACEAQEEWLDRDTKSTTYREKLKAAHPDLSQRLEEAFEEARTRLFPEPEGETIDGETGEILPEQSKALRDVLSDIEGLTQSEVKALHKNAAFAAKLNKLSDDERTTFAEAVNRSGEG